MNQWKESYEPVYDFVADDAMDTEYGLLTERKRSRLLQHRFAKISAVNIADGHHRAASAVKVGLKRRQEHPDYKGDEEFNFFLSVVFPDPIN